MKSDLSQISAFFERPGINKSGFCKELGCSDRYMRAILDPTNPRNGNEEFFERVFALMETYGTKREK